MASQFPGDRPAAPPPSPLGGGMTGRAKRLILEPKNEWPRIDAEPMTVRGIFTGWAVPLAAIGPVAGLIGQQVFGYGALGFSYRPSLGFSITWAVLTYILSLVGVYVLALVIDALAPTFNAIKNPTQAMKVAAFSWTAAWLAGIFNIIPMLAILAIVGLYSFYLLWLGLPILMRVPEDKRVGYFVATLLVGIVINFVVSAVVTNIAMRMATPAGIYAADSGSVSGTMTVPGVGSVDLGRLDAASKQVTAAAASAEAAAKTGAVSPNGPQIVAPAALQAMLPTSVGGFNRTSVESSGGSAAGIGGSSATGTYTQGDQSFQLAVTDAGALGALAGLGGALNVNSSKETASGYEKTTTVNGQMVEETWDSSDHSGKYSTMVANRFSVSADGHAPSIEPLKAAVAAIDQGKLASLVH